MEKAKKSLKIVLPIVLILISLVSIISFAGCNTDVGTLSENIERMNQSLGAYSFIQKNNGKLNTRDYYSLSYGAVVDELVESEEENYDELYKYYNSIFSLAMSYFDENISVVTGLSDEEMNDETRNSLNGLNQAIVDFVDELNPFVSARNQLVTYFNDYSTATDVAKLSELRSFKREYATFVDKAVQISLNLSTAVQATGDLDNVENVELVKNSICNKMLTIYHKLFVMNIGTFNWAESPETPLKTRVNAIISNLETSFNSYISLFQTNSGFKELTIEELNTVELEAEKFLTEVDDYLAAIDGLDLHDLAINNYNDLDEYLNKNANAEIYLLKIEQFVNETLPTYISRLDNSVLA